MRDYLRRSWEAETPRERDWHIYRAREYYERLRILLQVLEFGIQSGTGIADALLDQPPADNHISNALYKLQKRATKASLAPRICPNDDCKGVRYFLAKRTGQKYWPAAQRSLVHRLQGRVSAERSTLLLSADRHRLLLALPAAVLSTGIQSRRSRLSRL